MYGLRSYRQFLVLCSIEALFRLLPLISSSVQTPVDGLRRYGNVGGLLDQWLVSIAIALFSQARLSLRVSKHSFQ